MRWPFESLKVWQVSHELAVRIYGVTQGFLAVERYGLVAQLRRAAVAIPTNIAEGNARDSVREYVHFCQIARGSLAEVRYLLMLAAELGYLDKATLTQLMARYDEVGKMLHYLITALRKRGGKAGGRPTSFPRSLVPSFPGD